MSSREHLSSPTKCQVAHAKRRIIQFLHAHITGACDSLPLSFTSNGNRSVHSMDDTTFGTQNMVQHFSTLPEELLFGIISHLSGRSLLKMGCTCKDMYFLARRSKRWMSLVQRKIRKLNIEKQLHLSIDARGRKETYVILRRYFVSIFSVMLFLNNLERGDLGKKEALVYRRQIEDMFNFQLRITSPWKTSFWYERLQEELENFKPPPDITIFYNPKERNLKFRLVVTDGFYKDESIDFRVQVTESYPRDPPRVHMISLEIYHPFIRDCGLVQTPILTCEHWNTKCHVIGDVILDIRNLFMNPLFLTNYCTL